MTVMERVPEPGSEPFDDAADATTDPIPNEPPTAAAAEAATFLTPDPAAARAWHPARVLAAVLVVVAAVLLLLPTATVARPALIASLDGAGTVSFLAVTVDRVPWVTQLLCVADETCYIPNVGGDAEGFPTDMATSIVAARIAAQALTSSSVQDPTHLPAAQGPSAGLALGLAAYLEATGSRLGGRVAATGTLDPHGNVGPVSGVGAKSALAQADSIDLLLVPAGNAPLTGAFTGHVVEVATLTDALAAACALPGSECVPTTTSAGS